MLATISQPAAANGHTGTTALPPRPPLFLVGAPPPSVIRAIAAAAGQARLPVSIGTSLREADDWLEKNHPLAIVIDIPSRGAEQACLHVRYKPALANVPILGVTEEVTDLAFEELFGWGADDLIQRRNLEAMARRLRTLAMAGEIPLSRKRGTALVADPDRRFRVLTARALRNAGYSVQFALEPEEALTSACSGSIDVVITTSTFEEADGGETIVSRARRKGARAPWIVATPPKDAARMRAITASVPDVSIHDSFGPPENVLFVANEMLRKGARESRSSQRLLYGTTVHFRTAGAETDEIGYSYNLSAGGLYVRTLAPPPQGADVWLELRPPRSDRRVRLEGRVAWTRGFGPNDSATVPPGFGVQITGGSMGDLERYARGYRTFGAEMLAT